MVDSASWMFSLHDGQVVDGVVQTVLGGAQGAADVGNVVDGVLNGLQRIGSIGLVSDVQVSNTKRPGVTVIDSDIQLVVAGRGIADLQGQATLCQCLQQKVRSPVLSVPLAARLIFPSAFMVKLASPFPTFFFSICCAIFLCQRLRGIPTAWVISSAV